MKYLALLRGINVGGNNKVPMTQLKECLEELGYQNVSTYINSGNAIFESDKSPEQIAKEIEVALPKKCGLTSVIKILVLTKQQLEHVIQHAPKGFGEDPDVYHSDVAFLLSVPSEEALKAFDLNPEVDMVWQGEAVIYYRRLSAKRTQSRLSKIIGKPIYKSMTIRNWNTTTKILALMGK